MTSNAGKYHGFFGYLYKPESFPLATRPNSHTINSI